MPCELPFPLPVFAPSFIEASAVEKISESLFESLADLNQAKLFVSLCGSVAN